MPATISFNDFQKMDIRMGRIVKAEKAEGTEKLMKMQVDFGNEETDGMNKQDKAVKPVTRQVVASIAQFYSPKDLKGKQCPFLFNLEPRKFMGHESQGMLLAIDVEGDRSDCVLLHPNKDVRPGAKVV